MSQAATQVTRNELIQHLVQEKRYEFEDKLADHENHLESLSNDELLKLAEEETDEQFEIDEGGVSLESLLASGKRRD